VLFYLSLWSKLWNRGRAPSGLRASRLARRLFVEPLEERALLSGSGLGFTEALPLALDGSGAAFQRGSLAAPGAVDLYRFVAPETTRLVVRESATFDSSLDSVLTIFDASQQTIATNDDVAPETRTAQVDFNVSAGQTYYVEAAGFGNSTGGYALSISSILQSQPLTLGPLGSGSFLGRIDRPGTPDLFSFVAPVSGLLTVRQQGAAGSPLDSVLATYDGIQLLAFNDDDGNTRDSRVQFEVTAGQAYYVQAAGFDTSTGGYLLTFDTGPGPFPSARSLDLGSGQATVSGAITDPGGADLFRFTAPDQGQVSFRLVPTAGSTLSGALAAFDDAGRQITLQETSSHFEQFDVSPGRTYYVRVSSVGAGTGAYNLQFSFVVTSDSGGTKKVTVGDSGPPDTSKSGDTAKAALVAIPAVPSTPTDAGTGQAGGAAAAAQQQGGSPPGQVAALGPAGDSSLVLVATLLTGPGMVTEANGGAAPAAGGVVVQTASIQEGASGRATVAVQRGEGKESSDDFVPPDLLELFWQDWGDEESEAVIPALLRVESGGKRLPAQAPLVTASDEPPAAASAISEALLSVEEDT
jgi:hypothetical protein